VDLAMPTTLTPTQEALYRAWMQRIGQTSAAGQNVDANFNGGDYDYRGFFKKYGAAQKASGDHFTDEFKLPNHETFSDESMYATGANRLRAGHWNGDNYVPASMNQMPNMYDPYSEFNPQVDAPTALMQQPNFTWQSRLASGARDLLGNRDLALALLANSGPSPQRRSFGQILGASMQQADQAKQSRADEEFKRQYMQAQMAALGSRGDAKLVSIIGPDGKPVLVRHEDAIGKTPYAGGSDSRPSAFIQAYDRYLQGGGKLPMMDFAKEFAANQAQYPMQVGTVAGEETLIPRTNPTANATPSMRKLSTLKQEAGAKQELASAGAYGSTTGEKTAGAQFDLPRAESNVAQAL